VLDWQKNNHEIFFNIISKLIGISQLVDFQRLRTPAWYRAEL
jgi:hypothetical protein